MQRERPGPMTPRPCKAPGCGAAVAEGAYCERHGGGATFKGLSATRRGYGARWKRLRLQKLKLTPYCERCALLGATEEATEVHHIRPLRAGGTHALSNLASLSTRCHRIITAIENDSIEAAIAELTNPRPRDKWEKDHYEIST